MLWNLIYILSVLSQFALGLEIEDESEISYENMSSFEDVEDDLTAEFEIPDSDIMTSSEKITAVDDCETELSPEGATSFAGPVKAKGTVSVAATFGYDGSASYPSLTNTSPFWSMPGFFTQYYFPSPPLMISPMPIAFSPMPLQSMTFPGIGNSLLLETTKKNLYEENVEKPVRKDVFLQIIPLNDVDNIAPVEAKDPDVEELSPDEIVDDQVAFIDEDFTDYDEVNTEDNLIEADEMNASEPSGSTAFSGFVPASGTVKIAARF